MRPPYDVEGVRREKIQIRRLKQPVYEIGSGPEFRKEL
jgi:hypothetical protein